MRVDLPRPDSPGYGDRYTYGSRSKGMSVRCENIKEDAGQLAVTQRSELDLPTTIVTNWKPRLSVSSDSPCFHLE